MIKNIKQKSRNKKLEEKIENLKQQGFYFPLNIQSPNKPTPEKQTRLIRRIADWWETTRVEKYLEDIDYLLKNAAILNILSLLANFALIVSLVTWLTGLKEQRENQLFATWTIINDGKGDQSRVVRTAVERLNKEGFSLSGLELNETNLSYSTLNGADLIRANFSEADLFESNLSGAIFYDANLSGTDLHKTNLSKANLHKTNLSSAKLNETNLSEAYLFNAKNLSNAQIKLACNWKEAIYVEGTKVEDKYGFKKWLPIDKQANQKWLPIDKQANQNKIKEIEQDKDSEPKNPPDCSKWK